MKKILKLLAVMIMLSSSYLISSDSDQVNIYFHLPSKNVLSLPFPKTATLASLRSRLAAEWRVPGSSLRFSYAGYLLKEDDLLATFQADSANPILITYLEQPVGSYMPFLIFEVEFATNNDVMRLFMFSNDKVIDIKRRIQALTGVKIEDQVISQVVLKTQNSVLEKNSVTIQVLNDTKMLTDFGGNTRVIFSRKTVPDFAKRVTLVDSAVKASN